MVAFSKFGNWQIQNDFTGQFAALVGMSFKPKAIFLVGMDLWGLGDKKEPENVNNIYGMDATIFMLLFD